MALKDILNEEGRGPKIFLRIIPVDDGRQVVTLPVDENGRTAAGFLSYDFDQNMVVPVDAFTFTMAAPTDARPYDLVKDGDVVQVIAGDQAIATGIIDAPEGTMNPTDGEKLTIRGRDLLGQLEDQHAINDADAPFWMENVTVRTVASSLIKNTRIQSVILSQAPAGKYLFQSEPGESKLSALLRFLEPLNCLAWCDESGNLVIGRPNFFQDQRGTLFSLRESRRSNVLSYRWVRNATQIPNMVLPLFSGQELAANVVAKQQRLFNAAQRPAALRRAGHQLTKVVTVSHPSALDPNYVNTITVFNRNRQQVDKQLTSDTAAGNSLYIQQFVKRDIARKNMEELLVDVVVPGHFADDGLPYLADEVWFVDIDRASLREKLYCYAVKYQLDEGGQRVTTMSFCRLNTIVADAIAP